MADPVRFMSDNIVIVNFGSDDIDMTAGFLTNKTVLVRLKDGSAKGNAQSKSGTPIGLYVLDPAEPDARDKFLIYWCPAYNNWDGGTGVVVGSQAQLMFTDTMSMCSLGVGSKTPTGERLVVHLNQGQAATTPTTMAQGQKAIAKEQQRLQRNLLKQKGLKPLVEPLDYGGGFNATGLKNRSTTFGAWNFAKKEWQFYTHLYSRSGMTYTHAGLKKV